MTDLILGLATQFWPMTVFIILVIIGLIINLFDKKIENRVNFKYKEFPHLKPIPIATKGKVMIWFLIAAMAYPNSDLISFKINQQVTFNTKQECVDYLKTYNQYVKASIKLKFPNMKLVDIQCIDSKSALAMQEQMRSKK